MKKQLKKKDPEHGDKLIVAHGEVTGHYHAFPADSVIGFVDDVRPENTHLELVKEKADLTHHEHSTLTFTAKKMMAIRQSEGSLLNERIVVAD